MRAIALRGAMCDPGDKLAPDHERLLLEFTEWTIAPYRHSGPFDFANAEFLRRGADLFFEISRRRYTRTIPMSAMVSRAYFSLYGLFYRLGACIDVRLICDDEARVTGWDVPRA
jgi:hypothetical protein